MANLGTGMLAGLALLGGVSRHAGHLLVSMLGLLAQGCAVG